MNTGNVLRKIGKAALGTALALFFLIVLAVLALWTIPLLQRPADPPVTGSADWMAALPDDEPLHRISVPGTHDSGTADAQFAFFARCQSCGIAKQLEDGFRYLDIRLALEETETGTTLVLKHDFTFCRERYLPWGEHLYLSSVLADCYAFLDAHPGETIVFSVSREDRADSVAAVEILLAQAVREDPDYWYCWDDSRLPTLGEVRGKLVLVRRYSDEAGLGAESGILLDWHDQGGYSDPDAALSPGCELPEDVTFYVQDRYEYNTAEKWNAYCSRTDETGADDVLELRYLSTKGHGKVGHPYGYAHRLNDLLLENGAQPGWTVVDFGTAELAACIYGQNFPSEEHGFQ